MDHSTRRIILMIQTFHLLVLVTSQQTPCPNYFQYIRDGSTGEVTGHIQIPNPPRGVILHVKVGLSVATALPSKYVGRLELAQSKEESFRAVQQGRPLYYRIYFPLPRPIPMLTALWFNEQQYCSGPRANGRVVTSIFLEHTLYPPGVLPLSQNTHATRPSTNQIFTLPTVAPTYSIPNTGSLFPLPIDNVFLNGPTSNGNNNNNNNNNNPNTNYGSGIFNPASIFTIPDHNSNPRPTPNPAPPPPPPARPIPKPTLIPTPSDNINNNDNNNINININPKPNPDPNQNFNPSTDVAPGMKEEAECGRSNTNTNNINLLIARGMSTTPGQWPWLAAIFIVKIEFEFQCAGTLLTNKHVLTAAHCFKLDGGDVPTSTLLVSLGRFQLRDWRESGSVNREVAEYRFHPDYKHTGSADSDLAMIVLRETVEYSAVIKPVCLWTGPKKLDGIVGKSGYVVGWGRDELGNRYLAEPRMSRVPIVSQEDCLWSNTDFVAFTSNRTFCAGSRNGSGPCNGDSGSGLVIRDPTSGRYQLRGVVSRSLLDSNTMSCDLTQYVVYADVAKNMDWIQEQIAT